MSRDFLVAAHIKKRARCTDDEKRDLRNVTMLCCRFGCDELYERGFITIRQDGHVAVSERLTDPTALAYAAGIVLDRIDIGHSQIAYFAWHEATTFKQ